MAVVFPSTRRWLRKPLGGFVAKNISFDEFRFLHENGLHILKIWISREEGYEYQLLPLGAVSHRGECEVLAFRKSPRACFNYAKRHLTKREPDRAGCGRV